MEQRALQLRLRLAEVEGSQEHSAHVRELEINQSQPSLINPRRLTPVFNGSGDDLDAYLKRFQRLATAQEWPDKWDTTLSLCLSGEAF